MLWVLIKTYVVGAHKNLCCGCSLESPHRGLSNEHPQHRFLCREAILMSTHNIGFYEDLTKIIFELSSNMHLISSAASPLLTETEVGSFSGITFLDTLGS